jgi:hypothetical protein
MTPERNQVLLERKKERKIRKRRSKVDCRETLKQMPEEGCKYRKMKGKLNWRSKEKHASGKSRNNRRMEKK